MCFRIFQTDHENTAQAVMYNLYWRFVQMAQPFSCDDFVGFADSNLPTRNIENTVDYGQ